VSSFKFFSASDLIKNRRIAIATAVFLVFVITIDLLASRQILFFDNVGQTIIFVLTVIAAHGAGAWILLRYCKRISSELIRFPFINKILLAVIMIQISLFGILLAILFSNSVNCLSYFSFCMGVTRHLAVSLNAIASASATIVLGLISFKFFSWYMFSTKNWMILLYGLAAATLAMSIGLDAIDKILLLQVVEEKSPAGAIPQSSFLYKNSEKYHGQVQYKVVGPDTTTLYVVPSSLIPLHKFLVYLVSDTPYFFTWGGTFLLLRQYYLSSRITDKFPLQYYFLLSIPLVLYIIGSGLIISLPPDETYRYYFRIIFRAGTIGSSILFGLAFWIITRNVKSTIMSVEKVKNYLAISAIGLVMVGIANETSALQQTFGVGAHSLVLLSSFLFSIGLYYSAISISRDNSLRISIKQSIPDLVNNIGTAQMEQEMIGKITNSVRHNQQRIEEETGISSSITEDNIKSYLEQIINETKNKL
jgi:hypothetical protein